MRVFDRLNAVTKVATALGQVGAGKPLRCQRRRHRRSWYRINFSPGQRICVGKFDETLVAVLGGGTEKRKKQDIETAHGHWRDDKRHKRPEA